MALGRSKFNWSILDRQGLIDYFWNFYPEICDQEISISKFNTKLSKYIKQYIPVKVTKVRDIKVLPGWVYIGGTYYSEYDKARRQCIELLLVYHLFDDNIVVSKKRYKRICYTLADTILHEIMHMRQYRRRRFKELPDYASTAARQSKRKEQSYLGNSDEIDAYSFNIACELLDKFSSNPKKVINYLNKIQTSGQTKNSCWNMYLKAFDYDHNHPIIQRVKKKVARYIPHALNGKPYRNNDWIWR